MGFSEQWLALREPADHAARDRSLLFKAVAAAGPSPVVLDLGCGTGSTVRALGPLLPKGTFWRLVDNDPILLEVAGRAVRGGLSLHQQDISELAELPLSGVTLITASALLDLVTKQWLSELAQLVKIPVYFALSYDGHMSWEPKDHRDPQITRAFNQHQLGDKGLGPALGPNAVSQAVEVFEAANFEVLTAPSPWLLTSADQSLQSQLISGIATAAFEAGETQALDWGEHRAQQLGSASCRIGHGDILALPFTEGTSGTA